MNLILTCDVSGTGLSRMSAGANMERAEWDTGGEFDPQVSRRWRWGHLDRMLQGIVNSSFLINSNLGLYGAVGLYLDSICWFFRVKATTLVLEPAPGRFCRHFPEPKTSSHQFSGVSTISTIKEFIPQSSKLLCNWTIRVVFLHYWRWGDWYSVVQ